MGEAHVSNARLAKHSGFRGDERPSGPFNLRVEQPDGPLTMTVFEQLGHLEAWVETPVDPLGATQVEIVLLGVDQSSAHEPLGATITLKPEYDGNGWFGKHSFGRVSDVLDRLGRPSTVAALFAVVKSGQ